VDNPLTLNRYTYVHNNPLRYWDPSGTKVAEMGSVGGGGAPAAAPVIRSWNELLYIITAGVVSGTKVIADTQKMIRLESSTSLFTTVFGK